jgi:hypothetical protein
MARRVLRGHPRPVLQDRGQEFFPRHLDALIETDLDGLVLAALFEGAARITRTGSPPESQLLQDAVAVGIISSLGSPLRYLEIGGGPPVDHSNTAALDRLGWEGAVFEPNPTFADRYAGARSPRTHLHRLAVVGEPGPSRHMSFVVAGELSYVRDAVTPPQDVWAGHRRRAVKEGSILDVEVVSPIEAWTMCLDSVGVPSYVSVDVEGGEVDILRRMPWNDRGPTFVTAETSLDPARTAAMDGVMLGFGYERVLRAAAQWDNWYLARAAAAQLSSAMAPGSASS